MIFTQPRFFVFLVVVFSVHWAIGNPTARKIWLLACSLFFYGLWNWRFIPLLLGITFVDYFASRLMVKTSNARAREIYLSVSLFANLALLMFFKYYGFFVTSMASLLANVGFAAHLPLLDLIIPLGLSFHTFQAMAYTIDVYQGRAKPARSILDFALFITFFPQLVAGPVVRAKDFLPALELERKLAHVDFRRYLVLFLFGFFKKACVSDNIAATVDRFYAHPGTHSTLGAWLAIILYSVQIYCDFSGYTDMAIACAGLLGFELPPNFRQPYLSQNIQVFWHRWHISMSHWFRDYVYIPLGGSRTSEFNTTRNILITSLLSGLWHGADWKFVLWGLLHGISLVVHRWYAEGKHFATWKSGAPLKIFITFIWVTLLWVFFRAADFANAREVFSLCFSLNGEGISLLEPQIVILLLTCTGLHWVLWKFPYTEFVHRIPSRLFYLGLGAAFALVFALANGQYKPFIYFQF
jgi:alginate O-acetyltransferase complex protein AlgI